jgi:hypothetical protein
MPASTALTTFFILSCVASVRPICRLPISFFHLRSGMDATSGHLVRVWTDFGFGGNASQTTSRSITHASKRTEKFVPLIRTLRVPNTVPSEVGGSSHTPSNLLLLTTYHFPCSRILAKRTHR